MDWALMRAAGLRGGWSCVFVALAALGAQAETLNEALVKTYQTNPDLAAARAKLREVDEGVSQANARWRPSVSLEAEVERSSETRKNEYGKFNTRSETWSGDVVATQPLFTGGRNAAAKYQALARVRGARADLRVKEQEVLLDAVIAYVDVARNERVLDIVRQDVQLLQDLLQETIARRDNKRATDSDVDQTLAAIEAARAVCIANLADLLDSWRAYEQVVGSLPIMAETPAGEPARVNACIDAKGDRLRSTIAMPRELPAAPGSLEEVEKAA
ncbi:MAG: TolC family protein, partial [Alphaproteobacteria bacterium]|nr:TolC family protein [Alphaproteobacteria bacterium]